MSEGLTEKLRGLLDSAVRLASLPGLEQLAGEVLDEYRRLTRARGGSFYSREGSTLVLRGCLDPGHAPQSLRFPPAAGSALENAERAREPLLIRSFDADLTGSGWPGYRDGSALLFPLRDSGGEVIGFVSLHNRESPPFEPEDLELGRVLASLAGPAIESLRTAAALTESEQRYREIFLNSTSGIALFDVTGDLRFRVIAVNPAVERMMGVSAAQMTGKLVEEVLPAEVAERLNANYRACVKKGSTLSLDHTIDMPSGRRSVHTSLVPVRDASGRVRRLIALPNDVTDRNRAEEGLRESERRYREIFENTWDGIFVVDVTPERRFRVAAYNPAMERMVGVSNAEAAGRLNEELFASDTARAVTAHNEMCLQAGAPISFQEELSLPGGLFSWDTTLVPVRDASGRIYRIIGVARDVTENRRIERALRQSEEKFSKAFHASPDSITISQVSSGVILEANQGFTEANGYSREEAVGHSSLPDALGIWVDPRERAEWVRLLEEKGEVSGFEASLQRKDGITRRALLSSRTIEIDGEKCLLTISRDMTDRRRMEEALRDSEARYREIFENTSDGIFVVEVTPDQRFRTLSYNPAQEKMLGISAAEAVGRFPSEYLAPEIAERVNTDNSRCIEAGKPMSFEETFDLPGGRAHFSTTLVPVRDETGRIVRLIGVTRDFTERKRAEEREREHEKELFQAAKLASLGTLVSGVAHEINNPNNFIRLNSQNLKELWDEIRHILGQAAKNEGDLAIRGIPFEEARGMVEDLLAGIEEGSKRIEKLLGNLRDFARGDEGDLTDSVEVSAVIASAVMITGNLIRKSTDSFSVREAPGLPAIRGNYHQIEQVLINLFTNACQSLPSRDRGITVSTCAEEGWVRVEVEDQGVGIPPQNIPRVTDPFFTTKRASGGSGLGLAVSSRIVTNHGGTMSFSSQAGRGTRVTVRLPVKGATR